MRSRNQAVKEEEEEDDMQRFKENFALIPRIKLDQFSGLKVESDVSRELMIDAPEHSEIHYKQGIIWSVRELRTFLHTLSENPRYLWVMSSKLPQKTSKEIMFFYQAFQGLMRFENFIDEAMQKRNHLKNHKEKLAKALSDLVTRHLSPLFSHLRENCFTKQLYKIPEPVIEPYARTNDPSKYDFEQFNIQELVDIYSKHS
mmetsp:Transcript_21906/g.34029  ORF Transcript_21906/g.34029 Transcript_21906/m.34029 type:complete len:201 (-) Transcript_21906:1253-1855(-)